MAVTGARIGQILTRMVVPAWVLSGAVFKLMEGTARVLPPKTILPLADSAGIDLRLLLACLIGVEFLLAALMVCASRLARPIAIFTLSVFCLILLGEIVQGNFTSCGCMGDVKVPPWAMILIDGALLFCVIIFDPTPLVPARPAKWPVGFALLLGAAGFVWSFKEIAPGSEGDLAGGDQATLPTDGPGTNRSDPVTLPSFWYTSDIDAWVGRPWREVELFSFMRQLPSGLDSGKRYVVFYSRTCDHCEEMFVEDLIDPVLSSMVTAVEVPESTKVMTSPDAWAMPRTDVEHLQLPLGTDWIITTPLALRIVDGVVECATEGGHRECLELE